MSCGYEGHTDLVSGHLQSPLACQLPSHIAWLIFLSSELSPLCDMSNWSVCPCLRPLLHCKVSGLEGRDLSTSSSSVSWCHKLSKERAHSIASEPLTHEHNILILSSLRSWQEANVETKERDPKTVKWGADRWDSCQEFWGEWTGSALWTREKDVLQGHRNKTGSLEEEDNHMTG